MTKICKLLITLTCLILIVVNIGSTPVLAAALGNKGSKSPIISSKSAIVLDLARGQILYNSMSDEKVFVPIASDIMTILVAVEKVKLDTKVTIPEQINSVNTNEVLFDKGGKYGMDELLLSLILSPTPSVSNSIVQNVSKDTDKFVSLMNEKAKLLGMTNAVFTAPSSYDSANLQLTLDDFSKLVREAIKNPIIDSLLSISAKPWVSKEGTYVLINPNKLFWMGLEGINGGIYQSNNESSCSITTASREGQKLISIVANGKGDDVFTDTVTLMNYSFSSYSKSLLVSKDTVLHEIDFTGTTLPLASMEDVYYTHPVGISYIKSLDFKVKNDIKTPITENTIIGTARYTLSDGTIIDVNLHSKTEIKAEKNKLNELKVRLLENKDVFYMIIMLCIIEVFLIIVNIRRKIYTK